MWRVVKPIITVHALKGIKENFGLSPTLVLLASTLIEGSGNTNGPLGSVPIGVVFLSPSAEKIVSEEAQS